MGAASIEIEVVQMASKFDIQDSFIVIPQDAWLEELPFSVGDKVDIDGQTFLIDGTFEAETEKVQVGTVPVIGTPIYEQQAIVKNKVMMNFEGRQRFEPFGVSPPTEFTADMSDIGTSDLHIREGITSAWPELGDDHACRVSYALAEAKNIDRYDRIEVETESGLTEIFGVYDFFNEPSSAGKVVRMGGLSRDRLGMTIRSDDLVRVDKISGDFPVKIEKAQPEWEEVSTDPFSLRLSEWFRDNTLDGVKYDLEDVVEINNEGVDGYFGVTEYHKEEFVRPVIRMWLDARNRANVNAGNLVLDLSEVDPDDVPLYVWKGEPGWPEVSDEYGCRVPPELVNDPTFETNFNKLWIGPESASTNSGRELYGWVEEHNLDNTLTSIRMAQLARDRAGVSFFDPISFDTFDESEPPTFIDFSLSDWTRGVDEHALRVPANPVDGQNFPTETFYNVTSDVTGDTAKFGCAFTHTQDVTMATIRMPASARDRLGGESIVNEERCFIEETGEWPPTIIDKGQADWDNGVDEFAVRASLPIIDRLDLKEKETLFNVYSEETGEEATYGYWAQSEVEIYWPVVRMGLSGRERIGAPTPESEIRVSRSRKDIQPRVDVAQGGWEDEIQNALLCRVSQTFADKRNIEVGDYIKLTEPSTRRSRVFQVSDTETVFFDRMDSTARMAYWGRRRFWEPGNGETVPDEFEVEFDGFVDMDQKEYEYAGLRFSLSEWELFRYSERLVIHEDLVDDFDLDIKRDVVPTTTPEYGPEVNDSWDNLLLTHADYPDDRWAAYTAYSQYNDAFSPKIRCGFLAREKLANPAYDSEEDEVPNSLVVRVRTDVPDPEYTFPDNISQREFHQGEAYHNERGAGYIRKNDRYQLLVTAPHAGFVEGETSNIARTVADNLNAPLWIHEGTRRGGGSFRRWHITSSDVNKGFPQMEKLPHDYPFVLAIHGFSEPPDGIICGGTASLELRKKLCFDYIKPGIGDTDIFLHGFNAGPDIPFAGTRPDNFMNRMSENRQGGIQLEFPREIRDDQQKRRWVKEALTRFFINELDTLYR
ncbi:poly-gamma-glutamate hydrolase domain-containing protein [Haloarcula virus HCTV-16]|nr:poly-gamma-glutamate hydrolase domain-containing protein [Haloarcula virus HCTV-16]